MCGAAILCAVAGLGCYSSHAAETPSQLVVAPQHPVASDARIAGDEQQTRFVIDLDHKIDLRAFTLTEPDRVILDIPEVNFQMAKGIGKSGRGLIKAFRYGLVMPGGSRVVLDLAKPARIDKAYVLDAANGQPSRLIVELAASDKTALLKTASADDGAGLRPALTEQTAAPNAPAETSDVDADRRPVIVIDPGHGGIDNGTAATSGELEKTLVLDFANALRARIEKSGRFRVVMTRSDDTFIPLDDRVRIARNQKAALFVSIHADALPRREGDAQGATIYTLSDKASDGEAARLAEAENRADAIGGVNLMEEPTDVADILIDLAQRETRTFSNRFAKMVVGELKGVARLHKNPLKSAGFRVLKAPDIPSVLVELGYVSNKDDLQHLDSEAWRGKTATSIGQAVEAFFGKRIVSAGAAN